MHVIRSLVLAALAGAVATPAAGQIPAGAGRASPSQAAPKLLVANPYVFTSEDSASAVEAGTGLRQRLDRVVGNKFRIVARDQMNEALATWGYPPDAILAAPVARRFANELRAWIPTKSASSSRRMSRTGCPSSPWPRGDAPSSSAQGRMAPRAQ